jgi:hypothetical protein
MFSGSAYQAIMRFGFQRGHSNMEQRTNNTSYASITFDIVDASENTEAVMSSFPPQSKNGRFQHMSVCYEYRCISCGAIRFVALPENKDLNDCSKSVFAYERECSKPCFMTQIIRFFCIGKREARDGCRIRLHGVLQRSVYRHQVDLARMFACSVLLRNVLGISSAYGFFKLCDSLFRIRKIWLTKCYCYIYGIAFEIHQLRFVQSTYRNAFASIFLSKPDEGDEKFRTLESLLLENESTQQFIADHYGDPYTYIDADTIEKMRLHWKKLSRTEHYENECSAVQMICAIQNT